MTIDERLDRLTERHEALSQTVELIVAMQRDNGKNIRETQGMVRDLAIGMAKIQANTLELQANMNRLEVTMDRLS